MKRTVLEIPRGENTILSTVKITENGATQGIEGFAALMDLLGSIVSLPDLLRHGSNCPASINITSGVDGWILESVCHGSGKR
jgi:hypothetical protein